ncbi:type IV pilus modification PilV family protein [Ningiella sp. W23]|uniref:type IV pilus modification PilV family protein n=1 Tax=Ningiella sp. W23 TaxID=3023715 RepID=UPI0037578509
MIANSGFQSSSNGGFTLIELILGMVVFAVALVALANVFIPQVSKGIDPIWQVRAVTLAQSLSNEIRAKAFDENSSFGTSNAPCNVDTACTQSASLGPDAGESRDLFDDVDDYHGLFLDGSDIANSLSMNTRFAGVDVYAGFRAQVSVIYDDNADGINDDDVDADSVLDTGTYQGNKKLIRIEVFTPANESLAFSMYRENY